MLGGMTVDTEEQARLLSAMPECFDMAIEVGSELELLPCMPDHDLARIKEETGQECPRPGYAMDPDNVAALEILGLSIPEHTRHLAEGALRDLVPAWERPTIRRRVAGALQSKAILDRLYPPRKDSDA